jgi:catechol 2,3-dioxygenase-like lactoylglutathione lyase family enzyme
MGSMLFENSEAFGSMSSDDTEASRRFYAETLGLQVRDEAMGGIISVQLPRGGAVMIYPKDDHQPATYTVLNFPVDDVDAAVDELVSRGVVFEHYGPDLHQDEKGIMRGKAAGMGPDQAWFKDPAGNILSVLTP